MTNIEKARVIGRYVGCECKYYLNSGKNYKAFIAGSVMEFVVTYQKIDKWGQGNFWTHIANDVHPILRSIDEISDVELVKICKEYLEEMYCYISKKDIIGWVLDKELHYKLADYLRFIGIDIDNLIAVGIAIKKPEDNEKTT